MFYWAAATYRSSSRQIEGNNIWHCKRSFGLTHTHGKAHENTHTTALIVEFPTKDFSVFFHVTQRDAYTHRHKCTHCCRPAHMDVQKHTGEGLTKSSETRTSLHEETLLSDPLISYWRDGSGLTLLLFSLTLTTTLPLFLWEGITCLAYILQRSPVVFMFLLKCCSACNQQCYNVWAKMPPAEIPLCLSTKT